MVQNNGSQHGSGGRRTPICVRIGFKRITICFNRVGNNTYYSVY